MTAADRYLWWTQVAVYYRRQGRADWAAKCEHRASEIAWAWFFEEAA